MEGTSDMTIYRLASDLLAQARENDRAAERLIDQLFGPRPKDEFPENCDDVRSILMAAYSLTTRTGETLAEVSSHIGETGNKQVTRPMPPDDSDHYLRGTKSPGLLAERRRG